MKKLKVFVVLNFLVSSFIYAANIEWKDGYIVTLEKDTIYGEIGKRDNGDDHVNCMFRERNNLEPTFYLPNQLSEYGTLDGLLFTSFNVETANLQGEYFVQFLFEGIVNLYYIDLPNKDISYYLLKRNTTGVTILLKSFENASSRMVEKKRIRNTLGLFLADCQEIKNDINTLSGTRESLIKLLERYHHIICGDDFCIIYTELKPKKTHYLGVYIGGSLTPLIFNNYFTQSEQTYFSPILGVNYATSLGRFSNKWMFHTSLDISLLKMDESYPDSKVKHYDFSALKLNNNIIFEYRYLTSKIKPGFMVGIDHAVVLPSKNEYRRGTEHRSMSYDSYMAGGILGASIYIPIKNNQEIPLRFIYHRTLYGNKADNYPIVETTSIFSLTVGYNFKIR